MKLAVVFPGQGSQTVGMGKALYDAYVEARAVFEEVDEALGEKLSSTIFEGPEETLTLTANAQPALMAVSLAAFRALEAEGFSLDKASYVAGHSLGEYSALAAAGVYSIADTARLLRIRGEAMQAAAPVGVGAMAAIIGLEFDQVEQICADACNEQGHVQIANDNGGGQVVISGDAENVKAAADAASQAGAKRALMLPVSAPFHSTLMQSAADKMAEALAEVAPQSPKVPLIANVLAAPVSDPAAIQNHLVEQVCGRVRWRESVEFMAKEGVELAMEVGSGKVLTGLARRIARDIKGVSVGAPDDVKAALELLA
jgi:[acyl-carrier-protein] S-malonyltransferase